MRIGRTRSTRGTPPAGDGGMGTELIGGSSSSQGQPTYDPNTSRYAPNAGSGTQIGSQFGAQPSPPDGDLAPRFRPWSEPAAGAQGGPMRCHFLRSVGADGRLAEAQRTAVPTHRCAAFGDPLPLSLRQQELVCLQRVHVSCPRYVRGTLLSNEGQPAPVEEAGPRRQVPILTILGIGLVIVSIFLVASAAFGLPPFGGGAQKSQVAQASPTKSAAPSASVQATPSPTPRVTPSPAATPTASPTATPAATPTASPTPVPSATWPPGATASRMDLLVPCVGQSDCWVYTVRGAGPPPAGNGSPVADTLPNIAKFFGVSASKIIEMNPGSGSGITPGQKLKIPPPTR
jgi:hypothetical protein